MKRAGKSKFQHLWNIYYNLNSVVIFINNFKMNIISYMLEKYKLPLKRGLKFTPNNK